MFKCHSPSHNAAIVTPSSNPLETKSASASHIPTPLVTRLQLVASATASTADSPAAKIATRPASSRPRWYNAAAAQANTLKAIAKKITPPGCSAGSLFRCTNAAPATPRISRHQQLSR